MLRNLSSSRYFYTGAAVVIVSTCAAAWAGCSKQKTVPAAVAIAAPTTSAVARPDDRGKGEGKIKDVTVFIDGKAVAITRYSELPPGMKWYQRESPMGGLTTKRFLRVYDYVAALGVDPAKIKAIHFHGSHDRIAAITSEELVKYKETLLFDFSGETYGKPRMRWSTVDLAEPTSIDLFTMIAIYVDSTPPVHDEQSGDWMMAGKPLEGLPFVNELLPKGTRFYVDGKLMGAVKRRVLPDKFVTSEPGKKAEFSFAAYIESLGVELAKVKGVDFVNGDGVVYRAKGSEFEKADGIVFTISGHAKGKVLAHFHGTKMARVTSVQVFVKMTPPARELDTEGLDDEGAEAATETEQGSDDKQVNGGSGDSDE